MESFSTDHQGRLNQEEDEVREESCPAVGTREPSAGEKPLDCGGHLQNGRVLSDASSDISNDDNYFKHGRSAEIPDDTGNATSPTKTQDHDPELCDAIHNDNDAVLKGRADNLGSGCADENVSSGEITNDQSESDAPGFQNSPAALESEPDKPNKSHLDQRNASDESAKTEPRRKNSQMFQMTKSMWTSMESPNDPASVIEEEIGGSMSEDKMNSDNEMDENDEDDDSTGSTYDSSEPLIDVITDEPKPVSFLKMIQFADCVDYILMLVGLAAATGMGSLIPINFIIYGRVIDLMIGTALLTQQNGTVPVGIPTNYTLLFVEIQNNVKSFCVIGGVVICLAFVEMSFWIWTSERQTRRIRKAAFWALLNKHQGWFDRQYIGELTSRLNDDILTIQIGLGEKLAKTLEWAATFLAGYIIGFIYGWRLTLVILAVLPLLGIIVALFTKLVRKLTQAETESYAKAGAIAEEVFAAVRTVVAFGGEEMETKRYSNNLEAARLVSVKKGLLSGVMQGLIWFIIFGSFGLAFWYGSKLVANGEYTGGQVLQIFLGLLVGTTSVGHAVPYLETLSAARGAAAKVFQIIHHKSEIDSSSPQGLCPTKINGSICFHDVKFSYPTRKSVKILDGVNFTINSGQTMALIGSSGSGKSTIIQLIQRFYDPDEGKIMLDGQDLKQLNLKWLRNQVGVVSQEPVLFSTTIAENIRLGNLELTEAEVQKAAKQANVHEFIMSLPQRYETMVGEDGAQLSGGQKQRIAVARALVRNPKILLLDEATSALDTQSESLVQQALDKVSQGRTTLIIAHRLSTIKNADVILGLESGRVIEQGSHHELLLKRGLYHSLIKTQTSITREISMNSIDLQDAIINDVPLAEKRARLQRQWTLNRADSVNVKIYKALSISSAIEQVEDAKLPSPSIRRILSLNASESSKLAMGCFGAMLMGASIPIFSVVLSDVLRNFTTSDSSQLMSDAVFLALMFLMIGFISAFGVWAQNYFFAFAGANLTMKLRKLVFAAILRQEMGWFDDPRNQVGSLTSRLSNDAAQIQGAAGQQFGMLIQATTNMGTAIVIAFIYGPKLAGVIFAFIPLMFAAGIVHGKMVQDNTRTSLQDLEESAQVASEAIEHIRTVAALTRERYFQQKYEMKLRNQYTKVKKNAFVFGVFYALSQSIIFFAYAATFSYGGLLIEKGEMEFHIVFRVFACLIFGSISLGRALSWMPDYNKAKISAAKIFHLLDREPKINKTGPKDIVPETFSGKIDLSNVFFSYPMRPNVPVLRGLSLSVSPGQTVALVGTSGCGKSTIIKLLERFYDPTAGRMAVDDLDISCLSLPWLRSQMGLVSQEPVLFNLTIKENIAYGQNSRQVQMEEIIAAAKLANIHSFIEKLPLGYETNVGGRGTQLSGGQKQRIAIARALLRKPKILLLDEATSALDNESEKLVQEALNKARRGRTTLVIAHRLTTVKDADLIVVIHNGKVVEAGKHRQLMERRGFYFGLHRAQRCLRQRWKTLRRNATLKTT